MIAEKTKTSKPKLVVITGPTASGKTKLAVKLASQFNGEIVSADSRQVYRGMDVGTGKDLKEYTLKIIRRVPPPCQGEDACLPLPARPLAGAEGEVSNKIKKVKIPYRLIDVASPKTQFSLAKYQTLAYRAIDDIIQRGKIPFLTGGTGLYIQSITEGLPLLDAKPNFELRKKLEKLSNEEMIKKLRKMDPNLDSAILQNNKRRMIRYIEIMQECKKPITSLWKEQKKESKYDFLMLGIKADKITVNTKIDQRVDERLEKEKMAEEVERLHKEGVSWKQLESFGLEYKFIAKYLQGKLEYKKMVSLLKIASHQFAKRQITWFKRDKKIKWISGYDEAYSLIKDFL